MTSQPPAVCSPSSTSSFLFFIGFSTVILLLVAILLHIRTVMYVLQPGSTIWPDSSNPTTSSRRTRRGRGRLRSASSRSCDGLQAGKGENVREEAPVMSKMMYLHVPPCQGAKKTGEAIEKMTETLERVAAACERQIEGLAMLGRGIDGVILATAKGAECLVRQLKRQGEGEREGGREERDEEEEEEDCEGWSGRGGGGGGAWGDEDGWDNGNMDAGSWGDNQSQVRNGNHNKRRPTQSEAEQTLEIHINPEVQEMLERHRAQQREEGEAHRKRRGMVGGRRAPRVVNDNWDTGDPFTREDEMVMSAGSWGENENYRGPGRNGNENGPEGNSNDDDDKHSNGGTWYPPLLSTRAGSFIGHTGTDAGTSTAGSFKTATSNRSRYYACCPPSIVSTGSCAYSMDQNCNDSGHRPQMDNDNDWDGFSSFAGGRPSAESIFLMPVVGSRCRFGVGIEGRKLTEEMAEERHRGEGQAMVDGEILLRLLETTDWMRQGR